MRGKGIQAIREVHEMCIESCDPETFEMWERVREVLYSNRESLKHYHNASTDDIDTCAVCGHNIRHHVHHL